MHREKENVDQGLAETQRQRVGLAVGLMIVTMPVHIPTARPLEPRVALS